MYPRGYLTPTLAGVHPGGIPERGCTPATGRRSVRRGYPAPAENPIRPHPDPSDVRRVMGSDYVMGGNPL